MVISGQTMDKETYLYCYGLLDSTNRRQDVKVGVVEKSEAEEELVSE